MPYENQVQAALSINHSQWQENAIFVYEEEYRGRPYDFNDQIFLYHACYIVHADDDYLQATWASYAHERPASARFNVLLPLRAVGAYVKAMGEEGMRDCEHFITIKEKAEELVDYRWNFEAKAWEYCGPEEEEEEEE